MDTDLGFILPKGPAIEGLAYTDVTALEAFYWCEESLDTLLKKFLGNESLSANSILKIMLPILKRMFSIRVALTGLDLPICWIDGLPCVSFRNSKFVFDWKEYVSRLLGKSSNTGRKDEVYCLAENIFTNMSGDPRTVIHGHDFIELLRFVLLKLKCEQKLIEFALIFRVLALCKNCEDLSQFGTFKNLYEFSATS